MLWSPCLLISSCTWSSKKMASMLHKKNQLLVLFSYVVSFCGIAQPRCTTTTSLPCPSSCYWWHVPDPWLHSPRCRTRDPRWKVSWADPRNVNITPAMAMKKWVEQEHVKLDYIWWYIQQYPCMLYMVTLPSIYPSHVSIYIYIYTIHGSYGIFNNIPIAVYFPWIFNTSQKQQDVWRFLGPCWRRIRIGWWVNEVTVWKIKKKNTSNKNITFLQQQFSQHFPCCSIYFFHMFYPMEFHLLKFPSSEPSHFSCWRCSTQFSNRCYIYIYVYMYIFFF